MIVTFDRYVHYYDFSGEETTKQIMVDDVHARSELYILSQVEDRLLDIVNSLEEEADNSPFERGTAMIEALEFACLAGRPYAGRILVVARIEEKSSAVNCIPPPGARRDSLDSHRAL